MILLDFSSWWAEMGTLEQIYWSIAIPSTLAFLIIMVMTFMGGDMDHSGDVDSHVEGDHGIGFQFFTLKGFIGFFTIFSWIGLACIESGLSFVTTLIISGLSGLAMMLAMSAIFYFLSRVVEDGTLRMSNAIGQIGKVYLPIKANRQDMGQVSITVQGSFHTLQAMTDDDFDLAVGTIIDVKEIINNQVLLVTKHTK